MNEEARKQLSLLMDGELSDSDSEGVIRALLGDSALIATWECYHLISCALRSSPPRVHARTLVDRVNAALSKEPTVLAPRRQLNRYVKLAAGFAIAASVAAVAVLFVQQHSLNIGLGGGEQVAQIQSVTESLRPRGPEGTHPSPVVTASTDTPQPLLPHRPVVTVSSDGPQTVAHQQVTGMLPVEPQSVVKPQLASGQSTLESRFSGYLINHNEYGANIGMQGMLPYVRIVTYEPNE
ncbi:MAG: sigma-E factor negative regulatory protein [Gammaproteobacteria bacterium]|nr:sigma-E factor negative regulatory protein [Gammaproteobacteria bacterium]MCI0590952.1 sigma-E factor negative regulatory protein [Gammaproteobacteria bacterium]